MTLIKHFSALIILLLSNAFTLNSQSFNFYDVNSGLSNSCITSVVQDYEGYMWIATEDGLNRFDGSRFVIYRNIPGDSTSLVSNHVMAIHEDSQKRFWIATMAGLCLYDRTTGQFHPFKVPHTNREKDILQFYFLMEDHKGYLWASISGNGVVRIDPDNHEFLYFNTMTSGICSDHINVIYEDRFGNIWFGSGQNGLSIYNPANGTFRTFRYHPENKNGISSNEISSICEDMEGNVWVGTLTGGINIYSFANQSFRAFEYDSHKISYLKTDSRRNIWIGTMGKGFDVYSTTGQQMLLIDTRSLSVDIADTKVETLYEDSQKNIWIGFYQKGLFMIPATKSSFRNYTYNPFSTKETFGAGAVQPIYRDSHEELWIGVDGKGVYRLDKQMDIIKHCGPGDESGLFDHVALSILEDREENIWIGTFLNGAMRFNRSKNLFDLFLTKGDPPHSLLSSHIKDMKEDAAGRLWIATSGGGVNIYDPLRNTFEYLVRDETSDDKNQLVDNYCSMIYIDRDSIFWIATFRGLSSYDKDEKKFTSYTFRNKKLPHDVVTYLKEDSKGNLWVGTQNGIARFDHKREQISFFHIKDGLPNSVINGIEEDANGYLWFITNYGISMYDEQNGEFTNYTTGDGLFTNEFTRNAIVKTEEGEFIIGSMKGITSFNPSCIQMTSSEPINLLFTNLYVFNEKVKPNGQNRILEKTLNHSDKITLSHLQNSFSIEFTAIEYIYPEKVHYEVMIEGFDKQWRSVKNKMVTYTNLNPGSYTLIVRAWTNNREESLVRQLRIEILPPLGKTIWAKMLYTFLFLGFGYLTYRYINDQVSAKRQEQLIQEKLQFFTDISHEIRTPLTLILSPLNKLMTRNTDIALVQTYNTMYKNGIRLLQLVNQVMDLRAVEFGKKKLYTEETHITAFVRDLKNSFNNLAEEKGLSYSFTSFPEEVSGYIDTDIIAKVLFNLISNAFKFTENGTISVSVLINEKGKLEISITDTGKGIPADQQKQIFERFFTTSNPERTNSSGIGLHLTNKLVELHHGKIDIESEPSKGSRFSVVIPFRQKDYNAEERSSKEHTHMYIPDVSTILSEKKRNNKKGSSSTPLTVSLLVVDDNKDIRSLLLSELDQAYTILEASNGKEGLRIAIEKQPALIISDVIMPEMDGREFCRKIRINEKTSHIPFIMLTARASIEEQIEGLEEGADAYIAKPFNIQYLIATIERLVESRKKLSRSPEENRTNPEEKSMNYESSNSKLVKKINHVINQHLGNSNLSVNILCRELGLSRTHLNRKMKKLTGESPASYIRQLRLRKATQLLKEKGLTISEIAFAVGFSSPSYFSQAFREHYGLTPKEYMEMEKQK